MKMNEYQVAAKETAIYPEAGTGSIMALAYAALGLASEAGEVAGKVKKVLRDGNGVVTDENRKDIASEVADNLWYIAALAEELAISMDTMAEGNIAKLMSRKERGVIGGSGDNR